MTLKDAWSRGARTIGLLVAVAVVASASTAITAAAPGYLAANAAANTAANAGPVIACVVPDAGVLYSPADGNCEEADHARHRLADADDLKALQDVALAGLEIVDRTVSFSHNSNQVQSLSEIPRHTTDCPTGKIAVARGWELTDFAGDLDYFDMIEDRPTPTGAGWDLAWAMGPSDGPTPSVTIEISVTCVFAPAS